jgi:hypothetical protein
MKPEMRQKLAREPFEEKIRKVGQLVRLAKTFPRRASRQAPNRTSLSAEAWGRVAQINFRFGCGADIPVCRFWGLSSPRIPRQTVSFGPRSWKTSQPAGSKACPTNLSNTPLGEGGCSMKFTEDVRKYAAEPGIAEEEALKRGMEQATGGLRTHTGRSQSTDSRTRAEWR